MRRVRRIAAIAGTVILGLLIILALVIGLAWPRSALTGVALRFFLQQRDLRLVHATIHITSSTADFGDVDIKDGSGNDFFLAKNIHIIYDTRGLMGRGDRRFGLHSVLIDHPVLRLIHRADGSWNAGSLSSATPAPAATPNPVPSPSAAPLVAPYRLTLHIASGEVQVIDPQAPVRFARAFSVNDINGLFSLDEGALSHGTLRAHVRTAQGDAPLRATFFENDAIAFARAQVAASDVPIAPIVDAIVPSTSFALERGRVDLRGEAYAVGYAAGSPSWRLSADGTLRGGQLRVIPLAVPLRQLHGPLHFQDGQLSTTLLQGTAAAEPVSVHGGMQLLGGIRFALSANQTGRLELQRRLLSFSSTLPLRGPGALQLRLDGPVDDLRLSGGLAVREGAFGPIHLHALAGTFFYNLYHLTLSATDVASVGGGMHADGDVDLRGATPRFTLALVGDVPAAQVPVLGNVTRSGTAEALGTVSGTAAQPVSRGYVQVRGAPLRARAFFDAGPQRRILGPLLVQSGGGELMLLSRSDQSNGKNLQRSLEAIANQAHLRIAAGAFALPDAPSLSVSLPAVDGTFDGVAYADSGAAAPALALDLRARSLALAGIDLHDVNLRAGGQHGLVRISSFSARGGSARAQGSGSVLFDKSLRPQAAALHGTMDADLSAFGASAPGLHMSGLVQGQYDAMLDGGEWTLAAQTRSSDAQIAGVPVRNATATVRGQTGAISSLLAQVDVGGGTLSAVGALSQTAGAAPSHIAALANNIDLSVLKGFGVPVQGGSASGVANIAGTMAHPRIDAAGAVSTLYRGIPIATSVDLALADGVLHSSASRVAVDHNVANVTGSISGLGNGAALSSAGLDVHVDVRQADLSSLNRFVSARAAITGNTDAQMYVTGTAAAPRVSGYVDTGSGTFRGVTFQELHGDVRGQGRSWHLGNGKVQLGRSHFRLAGDLAPGSVGVDAMSDHVDMSDFNDFFGGSDVFAGTGNFRVGLRSSNAGLSANGGLRLDDAAVRNYQFGHIETQFSSDRGALLARLAQSGPGGSATLSGRVAFRAFARGLPEFSTATYDVKADVHNLDVDEITPLIGREDLGLTGSLDAVGTLRGSLHRPIANGRVNLHDGHLGRIAINSFSATLQSDTQSAAVRDLRFATRFLTGSGQGRYEFRNGQLNGALSLEAADLAELTSVVHVPVAITGPAHAQLGLAGTLAHPRFDAMLAGTNDTVARLAFSSVNARFGYVPGELTIGDTQLGLASGGTIEVKGALPIQLQPLALGPRQRPVGLTLTATKASLAELNTITGSAAKLDGEVNARANLSGTAGNPSVAGSATIRNASLNSSWETVPLTNAAADVSLSQDTIRLQNLHGKLGGGTIAIDGAAHIVPAVGLRTNAGLQFYTRVGLRNADVNVPGWLRGTFNGDLSLTKEAVRPYLSGSVGLSSATVPFSAILALATGSTSALATQAATPQNVPGVPHPKPGHTIVYGGNIFGKTGGMLTNDPQASPTPVAFSLPPVDFNVAVTAGKDVRVRGGSAIDLTADGSVLLGGSLSNPTLAGSFRAIRGQVGYFDTTFRLQRGTVTFDPNEGLLPTLDASAVTNVSGSEITLSLSGRVDNLSIDLLSNPPMTREEILATLLHAPQFNALTSGSQTALVQTAQNYFNAELTRSLLFPFESALAQSLNLEQVAIIFDPSGNLALEVRTHFSNNVSALYRSSLTVPLTQAYGVSYRLRDYLALEILQAQAPPPTGITSTQVTLRYLFR